MNTIIDGFIQIPAYVTGVLSGPMLLPAVIILFFYLTALFINRKWAHTIRVVISILLVAGAIIAFVMKEMPLACLLAGAFIVLIVFRLLVMLVTLAVESYKNSKIERQALRNVAMRRGNRMMRSSAAEMPGEENNNTSSMPEADKQEAENDNEVNERENLPLTRAQLTELTHMLKTLREFNLLTEEEFKDKTQRMYERLG